MPGHHELASLRAQAVALEKALQQCREAQYGVRSNARHDMLRAREAMVAVVQAHRASDASALNEAISSLERLAESMTFPIP